jgi:hypothetical protein
MNRFALEEKKRSREGREYIRSEEGGDSTADGDNKTERKLSVALSLRSM